MGLKRKTMKRRVIKGGNKSSNIRNEIIELNGQMNIFLEKDETYFKNINEVWKKTKELKKGGRNASAVIEFRKYKTLVNERNILHNKMDKLQNKITDLELELIPLQSQENNNDKKLMAELNNIMNSNNNDRKANNTRKANNAPKATIRIRSNNNN